jgi:hypothetical protein
VAKFKTPTYCNFFKQFFASITVLLSIVSVVSLEQCLSMFACELLKWKPPT